MEWSTVIFLGMGMISLVALMTVIIFGTKKSSEMKALEKMLAEKTKLLNSDTESLRKALQESEAEKEQMLQRIQNLEAIVTSEEWGETESPNIQFDSEEDTEELSDADKVANRVKRVR
ncbi:hypothetical protein [Gracilimonas tropica]|uniref:hypothetical protein n=1 Tax=Gracilimonas tropica TaxID=454600 RepID=UPI000382CEA0|nr:hypothetical protein [Gracilimonas tropica]